MADVQVTCITKQANSTGNEGITHLGGSGWRWTREQVIVSIEGRTNTFYTKVNGQRADIGVVNSANGKYLRTHADGTYNDNLLALPTCPA